jgi:hypothetical protein
MAQQIRPENVPSEREERLPMFGAKCGLHTSARHSDAPSSLSGYQDLLAKSAHSVNAA